MPNDTDNDLDAAFEFKPFRRMPSRGVWLGVAAGLAYCLGVPVWVVRLIFIVLTLQGLLLYLVLAFILPSWSSAPQDYEKITNS